MRGALILAGGRSKRFGRDKCGMEILGKRLVEYVLERLSFLDELRVSLRKDQELKNHLEVPVSFDEGANGPLEGIVSGLRDMTSDYIFITACDMPLIRRDAVERLFSLSRKWDAVIPVWKSGYMEPLHAVYRREEMLRASEEALRRGERRVASAISKMRRVLRFPAEEFPEETFFNVNSEEDIEILVKFLTRKTHENFE